MNSRFRNILAATLICGIFSTRLVAGEWARFRGPNGSGISTQPAKIPAQWTEKDYNWNVKLPGSGHSSPIVVGQRIFVTCADAEGQKRILLCLRTSDGSILWRHDYPLKPYRHHNDNSFAAATPAADQDRVYIYWTGTESSSFHALDHDGKEIWTASLPAFKSQHGSGASPIVFEDLVILPFDQEGSESFVIAFDRKTGQTAWKINRTSVKAATATPCLYAPPGQPPQLILTSQNEGFLGMDPRTGKRLWQLGDVFDRRVCASPVVASDLVVGNCGEGTAGRSLYLIRPGIGDQKPGIAWKLMTNAPYVPTPLAKDGLLYLLTDTGTAGCFRIATGEPVWQERLNASFYGSPICINDRLYAISKRGEVFVWAAGEKFQLIARNPLNEGSFATPAVADGRLYLRTFTHLISIGRAE